MLSNTVVKHCTLKRSQPDVIIAHVKVYRHNCPVVMAGVLGIYGLIASVIINGKAKSGMTSDFQAYQLLSAGLTVGWFSGGTFFVN